MKNPNAPQSASSRAKADLGEGAFFAKSAQLELSDVPKAVLDRWLIFSFVRNPFTRVVSSYGYSGCTGHSFADVLRRDDCNDAHMRSQSFELFGPSQRGSPRIDFVGHLETIAEDWERLLSAMTPEAVKLTPEERRRLIPPRRRRSSRNVAPERVGLVSNGNFQPQLPSFKTKPIPFTVEQVLQVCRRYLQDLVCFGYGIPRECIAFAKEIF